jgi:peptide/nickel transport system permease protein
VFLPSIALFVFKRLLQLLAVIFGGCSAAFFISHLSPVNPVEITLGRVSAQANMSPEAEQAMRATLTELFGLDVPLWEQFINFWRRFLVGDFGPSLMAFPRPAMQLVMLALPWTAGLLIVSVVLTWIIGNLLGGLAGFYQNSRILKAVGIVAVGIQPIPYYIVAFLMVMIFGFVWPVLPISGGFAREVRPEWSWTFALSVLHYSILPALSLVVVGIGGWFLGMRALVSNIVTEDYVTYAELAGVKQDRIVGSYVMRNALVPQLTALGMALGGIFSGTIITEQVFTYPGLGSLLVNAVNSGDQATVLAVSSISIVTCAVAIFVIDLIHPLLDPRVKAE